MKSNKKGKVFMMMGLLLIAAAFLLSGYNIWEGKRAEKSVEESVSCLEEAIFEEESSDAGEMKTVPDYILNPDIEMPIEYVNGNGYIGILNIPSLGLELSVMSEWSYPNLKISPCRYKGSAYQNNLIILAHNYTSHFGTLKNLRIGDSVTFTDVDGNVFCYKVAELEVLMPTAIEEMQSGNWDLTLFTCTLGGQSRVTVRCELADKDPLEAIQQESSGIDFSSELR